MAQNAFKPFVCHGFGYSDTVGTSADVVAIEEPAGTPAKARNISLTNQGGTALQVLFNVPSDADDSYMDAYSYIIVPPSSDLVINGRDSEGFYVTNVMLRSESGDVQYTLAAY